jgi:NADPH:quinone reductase-like Zn-dependent oxidoreductase
MRDRKSCYITEVIGGRTGAIAGCDFAGVIVQVGPDVEGHFKLGDRVAGWTHGSCALHPEFGAFCEYVACDEHAMWKLPDSLSFESAATASVSISTAGLSLFSYNTLNFPFPNESQVEGDFLVYGGGTSTGQILIQFAKRLGLRVIIAASQRNHEMLKGYGADVTVDYKDPDACIEAIRRATGGKLKVWRSIYLVMA